MVIEWSARAESAESVEKIPFSTPDEWDLIKTIANFLSKDPRVSIKELAENALDAFSRIPYDPPEGKEITIIIRKKDKKSPCIKVVDNGPGWVPHNDSIDPKYGRPDFEYTVEHIGDSVKKKLAEFNKARAEGSAVGQFAIGLFSFWALGGRLTIYSRSILNDGKTGPCSLMVWHKEVKDATIKHDVDPPAELATKAGTVVIVDKLEKAQMNLVTSNILAKHLSRACRTLLMKSGAVLILDDHGLKVPVKPKKYDGYKFSVTQCETIGGFGPLYLEVYAFPPVESPDEYRVPVFCKGAKVYDDVTELPELDLYPWNAKKIYGEINYPFGNISPSRSGFNVDNFLDAFIKTVRNITNQIAKFVDDIEARKKAKQKDKFYRVFRETWQEIFKMLSEEWRKKIIGPPPPPPPPPPLVKAGPMHLVEISPKDPKVACNTVQSFTARPYDINGNIIRDPSLIYYWKSSGKPLGRLKDEINRTCNYETSALTGIATLSVAVLQHIIGPGKVETIKRMNSTNVWVVDKLPPKPPSPPPTGDRPPALEEKNLGEDGPHAKFESTISIVYVNDHHKDYIEARNKDDETLYRYVNYCFAKEIAVDRWKSVDPHELSEKIVDLVAISERLFDWKELIKKPRGRQPKELEPIAA